MRGINRNRKKKGIPYEKRTALARRDPASRISPRIQRFVTPPP